MTPPGRPEVGQPINIRLGDELLASVDKMALAYGWSRAMAIRHLVAMGLDAERATARNRVSEKKWEQ